MFFFCVFVIKFCLLLLYKKIIKKVIFINYLYGMIVVLLGKNMDFYFLKIVKFVFLG